MADKFEDLRTYVTVVSCGGINAAAAKLGVAKSAVSRRVSELEERLGTTLIDRTTRRFEVTSAGRHYFDRASGLLAELEELDSDPAARNTRDRVSLAAAAHVARHLLATPVAEFLRERPSVTVTLMIGAGDADVVIASGGSGRHLADVRYLSCASPGRRAAPGLRRITLIEPGSLRRPSPRPRDAAVETADADLALARAIAGAGIARLPDFVVNRAIADGSLEALGDADSEIVQLTASVANGASAAANALVEALVSGLAARR